MWATAICSASAVASARGSESKSMRYRRVPRLTLRAMLPAVTNSQGRTESLTRMTLARRRHNSKNDADVTSSASWALSTRRRTWRNTRSRCRSNSDVNARPSLAHARVQTSTSLTTPVPIPCNVRPSSKRYSWPQPTALCIGAAWLQSANRTSTRPTAIQSNSNFLFP